MTIADKAAPRPPRGGEHGDSRADRFARRARALRENLRRRKRQARERAARAEDNRAEDGKDNERR